jgi:hypothetical protein
MCVLRIIYGQSAIPSAGEDDTSTTTKASMPPLTNSEISSTISDVRGNEMDVMEGDKGWQEEAKIWIVCGIAIWEVWWVGFILAFWYAFEVF